MTSGTSNDRHIVFVLVYWFLYLLNKFCDRPSVTLEQSWE